MGLCKGQLYVTNANSFRVGDAITLTVSKSWYLRAIDWLLCMGKRPPLVVTDIDHKKRVISLEGKQ